jgi:hypothetical protein
MMRELTCPVCGARAKVIEGRGCDVLIGCSSCGRETYVLVHPIINLGSMELNIKEYDACVEVEDPSLFLKSGIKVKKIFRGYSNFRLDELQRQIERGDRCWNLGAYSQREVEELLAKAEEFGLKVSFQLRQ